MENKNTEEVLEDPREKVQLKITLTSAIFILLFSFMILVATVPTIIKFYF